MKLQDVDALAAVIEQAIGQQRQMLEARIDERVKACIDADRAVELAREAVDETEDRLREILQQRTSEAVDAMRHAATEELARVHDLLLRRLTAADKLTEDLVGLREQLATLVPKDGASAYDLAVTQGFQGSAADWLASLRGTSPTACQVAEELAENEDFCRVLRGEPGAGIEAPQWKPGIHREGGIVQAHFGQYFRALCDTTAEPYGSDDWQRIGCAGFHLAEPWHEGRSYEPGDLFVRDFGLFTWTAAGAQLLVGRGRPGDPGPRGERGKPGTDGKDGRDGAGFQAFELQGTTLAVVMRSTDGELQAATVDLLPVFEKLGEAIEERLFARLVSQFGGGTAGGAA